MQANEKVITALNLPGDFLPLAMSVSYVPIHLVDLSVFGPRVVIKGFGLDPCIHRINAFLFQQNTVCIVLCLKVTLKELPGWTLTFHRLNIAQHAQL